MKTHVQEKHEYKFKTILAPLCGLLSSNLTDMWSYDYPRLPKVLCPLWLWKNGKSMPTPITRAWNFLKRCADARVCIITSHRYAYGVNIMTAFWIPIFNMPTFSSNKSQPSFKLGVKIHMQHWNHVINFFRAYSGVWMKSHVWFFFEYHNFTFFFHSNSLI